MRSPYDRPRSISRELAQLARLLTVFIGVSPFVASQALAGLTPETGGQQFRQSLNQQFTTELSDWLQLRPDDEEIRFLYARVLTWDRHWDASLAQYDTLLASSPDNVDYLFGKAQVLIWSGQPATAVPLLERARALAPDYAAVDDLYRRAVVTANEAEARSTAELAALTDETAGAEIAVAESDVAIDPGMNAIGSFTPQAQIMAAASMDFLDNGFDDWTSLFVGGDYRFRPRGSVYGQLRSTDRFNEQDIDLTVGVDVPMGSRWSAFVQGSVGPDAEILPRWTTMAGVRRALPRDWAIEASFRHSEYASTYGDVMALGVERYWREFRFSYHLHRGKAEGAKATLSHVIRSDYYYGDYDYIGFIVANGEEAESVGLNQLLVSDIETYGLTGQHWLTDSWALAWAVDYHKQGKVYTRQGIYFGVKHKF